MLPPLPLKSVKTCCELLKASKHYRTIHFSRKYSKNDKADQCRTLVVNCCIFHGPAKSALNIHWTQWPQKSRAESLPTEICWIERQTDRKLISSIAIPLLNRPALTDSHQCLLRRREWSQWTRLCAAKNSTWIQYSTNWHSKVYWKLACVHVSQDGRNLNRTRSEGRLASSFASRNQ